MTTRKWCWGTPLPTAESTQYGAAGITQSPPFEGTDLVEQLHEAIQHIHGEYTEHDIEENNVSDILPADPSVRNYSFTLVDGDVFLPRGRHYGAAGRERPSQPSVYAA